jgi:uncharacterized ferritin-like protein (DUF455 family)
MKNELRHLALEALTHSDWHGKAHILSQIDRTSPIDFRASLVAAEGIPGRPVLSLVAPSQLPQRSVNTHEGRAGLIHSLAHIEFNAINLALDVLWRFADMPEAFYRDWLTVAQEESLHFSLLHDHLKRLGYAYGDFACHDGLWEMAERTQGDVLARLALVPRTLEARGLDASPLVRHKLASGGDKAAAEIVDLILRDEIGHVAIGNKWYRYVCDQRGLDPITTYRDLSRTYRAPTLKGPFNLEARRAAGFEEAELTALGT